MSEEQQPRPDPETTALPGAQAEPEATASAESDAIPAAAAPEPLTKPEQPEARTEALGEKAEPPVREPAPAAIPPAREPEPAADAAQAARDADEAVLAASRRHTRRAFLAAGVGAAAGVSFYEWLLHSRRIGDQPELLRQAYRANAALSLAVFDERALAPTYALNRGQDLRINGVVGLEKELDLSSWRLQMVGVADAPSRPGYTTDVTAWEYRYTQPMSMDGKVNTASGMAMPKPTANTDTMTGPFGRGKRGTAEAGESASTLYAGTPGLLLTMDAITKLPRHEFVTQFKCIEGWSRYVHWAGYRLRDFLEEYPPAKLNGKDPQYLYMETPDGNYYTGYNMIACRHPQSLLVTEMMGQPLSPWHGAPVRLHMPIKYGYKQIKRIGLMRYMFWKPDDYWTKLGYDWFGGI